MRIQITEDLEKAKKIREALSKKDWHCPCSIEVTDDTLCPCKEFRTNTPKGEYCHCGLWKKIEN